MMLIRNNIPTRASLPAFLIGLQPESLLDLHWTDPALGVQGDAYWPEEVGAQTIDINTQRYGDEILTLDPHRSVVIVSREVAALTDAEISERLAAARIVKNDEINAERERRTFDTFTHSGKAVACDTLSRSDIDGINGYVALNNAFPAIWPGVWKCADNTYLTISTIDEWKLFYGSMVAAGSALYAHAQELKAALAKATTAEEIAAIHW